MSSRDSTPLLNRQYVNPYKIPPWYKNKRFYLNLIRRSMAEFLGTALFVFVGVSSVSNIYAADPEAFQWDSPAHPPPAASAVIVALAFGLGYAGLMAATMAVSGGHLNPAVTLAVFVAGGVNVLAALCYFVAQIVGGIVGSACVLAYDSSLSSSGSTPAGDPNSTNYTLSVVAYGVTKLSHGVLPWQGILVETLLTLMLVSVFLHTTVTKSSELRSIAPVLVGLTVAAGTLSGYTLTGGSMNPARSFGPPVVGGGIWRDHYVYWVGPLLGGLIGGGIYRLILSPRPLLPLLERDED